MTADLDKVFKPRNLALVGASNSPGKWGSFLLVNLLSGGFPKEDVYPVNLKEKEVHGLPAYPSLSSGFEQPVWWSAANQRTLITQPHQPASWVGIDAPRP